MSPKTPPSPDGSGQVSGGVAQPAIAAKRSAAPNQAAARLRQIVDAARGGEEKAPDHRRRERGDGRKAEELHRQVGKDCARIAHRVGDRRIGGMAETRVGDVPGAEAGKPEGDGSKKAEACKAPGLAAQESLKPMPSVVQRNRC